MHPSDEARYSGRLVYPYTTDASEQTDLSLVRHPRLVWNRGLAISPKMTAKDQSTSQKASGIYPCSRNFARTPPPQEGDT